MRYRIWNRDERPRSQTYVLTVSVPVLIGLKGYHFRLGWGTRINPSQSWLLSNFIFHWHICNTTQLMLMCHFIYWREQNWNINTHQFTIGSLQPYTSLPMRNRITYPLPNFTVDVWEWVRYFNPHFIMEVIIYPCWYLSYIMLVKRAPGIL